MNTTMSLSQISPKYHAEMTGAFAKLADKVRAGEISSKQFMAGQKRIYTAYRNASK